jgi:methyl-accepting chemotaxis protein
MQSVAITQINQGIEQISSVIQANAATSEENAAASQELSSQADILEELIAKIKRDKQREYSSFT